MIRLQRITTADTDLYSYMEKLAKLNRSLQRSTGNWRNCASIQI